MKRYCPRCGKAVDSSDNFCKYCGNSLTANSESSEESPHFSRDVPSYLSGPMYRTIVDHRDSNPSYSAHKKHRHNQNNQNRNVVINVSGNHQHGRGGGDVVAAINYAYKEGALGSPVDVHQLISIGANHNSLGKPDCSRAVYSIVRGYKNGSLGSTADVFDLIAKALK